VSTYKLDYQITSVAFSKRSDQLFFGGVDNSVKAINLRKGDLEFGLFGHTDTVTGMQLSASGDFMLTNAMDNTVRIWDVRPFVEGERLTRIFTGASHNFERNTLRCGWGYNDKLITAGSADRVLYIWDVDSGVLKHRLGGHQGSVNDC
jgi:Prp8 binding protein